ncbi:MAG: TolC family protein [Robiginitomaculum sp.]|nr:TolC family protein [Robiginitomaculum sp.]
MFRILLPSMAALSLGASTLFISNKALAQLPLTLPETVTIALNANDPSVSFLEQEALAFENLAIADSQLPDPTLRAQIANFPLSSFDYNREAMTQLKFGISQTLPKGQTLSLTRHKRGAQAQELRAQKTLRERQIALEARQIWLELYYWQEARKLILESQKKVGELGGVAESVYASGRSSLQDVLRVELETSALGAKLIDIDRNADIARANLERLVGRVDGARPISSVFPVLPRITSEGEIRDKLSRHPSMRVLDARVETKSRDVDIAAEQYKPGYSFDAQYGLRDSRSDLGSIGVSVSLPLFSKTNKDYALSAAKRMRSSQKLQRDVQALDLERSLRKEWAGYTRLGDRISLYESSVLVRARETSEAAMIAYGNKLADFSELVRAELAVLDIELTLTRLQIDRMKAGAYLLYLSGE